MYANIVWERTENVVVITLNRPRVLNALNRALKGELADALAKIKGDESIRAVVITGAGEQAFSAGQDLTEAKDMNGPEAEEWVREFETLYDRVRMLDVPVIAAVNGWALGGGCELALACHVRFCSDNAKFGLPEVSLGIIPGYGGTQRLSRLVGLGRAVELVASGRTVDAPEALRIGLVQHVTSQAELMTNALALAEKIAGNAPLAVSAALESMVRGQELALADGLALESTMFGILGASEDMHEGLKAFLEKRKATFHGR